MSGSWNTGRSAPVARVKEPISSDHPTRKKNLSNIPDISQSSVLIFAEWHVQINFLARGRLMGETSASHVTVFTTYVC